MQSPQGIRTYDEIGARLVIAFGVTVVEFPDPLPRLVSSITPACLAARFLAAGISEPTKLFHERRVGAEKDTIALPSLCRAGPNYRLILNLRWFRCMRRVTVKLSGKCVDEQWETCGLGQNFTRRGIC